MKDNTSFPPAIFLMGPTASGKTDLAIRLVQKFPCDIISVDSALVYRGMDIGTAKPDASELALAPHRLIDIRDPADPYSAAEFREDALREMAEISSRGRIPLLVGGTMMYFRTLEHGLSNMPSANADIRQQLSDEAESIGWPAMHEQLAEVDPVSAGKIKPTDPQRIQRALEVFRITGRPMSAFHQEQATSEFPYDVSKLAISPEDRGVLHQRIELRFQKMMENGFADEMTGLFERDDLHADLPSMRSVGYRQGWAWLAGEYDQQTMIDRAIIASRQLAKRQLTWLRADDAVKWFDPMVEGYHDQIEALIKV